MNITRRERIREQSSGKKNELKLHYIDAKAEISKLLPRQKEAMLYSNMETLMAY